MPVTDIEFHVRHLLDGGRLFGEVGQYEELRGTVRFAVDPLDDANNRVTDIENAPRNADGLVEFESDIVILRPADTSKGARRIVFDVLNRGRRVALAMFNSALRDEIDASTPADIPIDVGNGWLMRDGWTVVWTGWQADAPPWPALQRLRVPEATQPDGAPLVGRTFSQFQSQASVPHFLLSDRNHRPRPAFDINESDALLTVREHPDTEPEVIPRERWSFARDETGVTVADPNYVWLDGGFDPGRFYQLTYTTHGAPVMGLGFLAMRDSVAFLKHGATDSGNPCANQIDHAYAFGVSQSGRFLRTFLYLDLNRCEDGAEAFDGVMPHVAGGMRGEFNQRFGQPSKDLPSVISQLFPFAASETIDPKTEEKGALLARMRGRDSSTKVFFSNTSAEYWRGDASLIHTDPDGVADVEPGADVRIYALAGAQHGPGFWPMTDTRPADGLRAQNAYNSLDYTPLMRGLLTNLHDWAANGVEPPPSNHPRVDNGSAVPANSLRPTFATIPGASFPRHVPIPLRTDFGDGDRENMPSSLPPSSGAPYGSLVSNVNGEGNEIAGLLSPDLPVPLATYTPWNARHPDMGAPDQPIGLTGGFGGSTFPFPATRADRAAASDSRRSIEERYGTRSAYLESVREAAKKLAADRIILDEDIDRSVTRAAGRWDVFTGGKLPD